MRLVIFLAFPLIIASCQQPPEHHAAATPNVGRFQTLSASDGAIWKLDSATGDVSYCMQGPGVADKEGWQQVKVLCTSAETHGLPDPAKTKR